MKTMTVLFFALTFLLAATRAEAGQAEVRAEALANNCPPKKIEIYKQQLGSSGKTVYQVQCTLPKVVGKTDTDTKPPDAIFIACDQTLCAMTRAVGLEKK